MTRLTTNVLAALTTTILVLSVLSGVALAVGHASTGVSGLSLNAPPPGASIVVSAVPPSDGPSAPVPTFGDPNLNLHALPSGAASARDLSPFIWGIDIHPDGSVSGTGAGQVAQANDRYYNFSADYTGSILDERNGSIVNGGGDGLEFRNSTGNEVDLLVLNSSNVQIDAFYFYSGFVAVESVGSTNVTFAFDNNTNEPADSATYGGSTVGALTLDSTGVTFSDDAFNGTEEGIAPVLSGTVHIDGGKVSGGAYGVGDGIFAADDSDLQVDGVSVGLADVGILAQDCITVTEEYDLGNHYDVQYGVEVEDSEDVYSIDSNFSTADDGAYVFAGDESVAVEDVHGSDPVTGTGLEILDSTYLYVDGSDFDDATGSLTSAGILLQDDSCLSDYCTLLADNAQDDIVGLEINGTPLLNVHDTTLSDDESGFQATYSWGDNVVGSNLSDSGYFLGAGVGALLDNDSDIELSEDQDSNGFGSTSVYLYDDSDMDVAYDILANSTGVGVRAGANTYLEVEEDDISDELGGTGVWIDSSADLYIDDNNVTENTDGIVDTGVSGYGEFNGNVIDEDEYGIWITGGSSFEVESNVMGFDLAGDFVDIEVEDCANAEIASNQLGQDSIAGVVAEGGNAITVSENNVTDSEDGVYFQGVSGGEIQQNDANDTGTGAYVVDSNGVDLLSNFAIDDSVGVELEDDQGTMVQGTDAASDGSQGVLIADSEATSVLGNNFTDALTGVELTDSFSTTIQGNQFVSTTASLDLDEDAGTSISQNDFIQDGGYVLTSQSGLLWNASYPEGGNYWSNLTTVDTHSGPQQNLAGADGINDTPFVQDHGTVVDQYPLVYPIAADLPTLVFTETGLPGYTAYEVEINLTANGTAVQTFDEFGETNYYGVDEPLVLDLPDAATTAYTYEIQPVQGYVANPTSGSGWTPRGALTTTIAFTQFPYVVTFAASGIAAGTSWNVVVNSHTYTSTTLWDNVSLGNGTYTWSADVTGAPGVSGTVTVEDASTTVPVPFRVPTYTLAFTETGLPTGATWSVSVNGEGPVTSGGDVITFEETNGSYAYTVTNTGTATPSSPSGTLPINGAGNEVVELFKTPTSAPPPGSYSVVFTETGLASGASWSVVFGGESQSAIGSVITFVAMNGTFAYTVSTTGSIAPTPASGSVTVAGSAVGTAIAFGTAPSAGTTTSNGNGGISSGEFYAVIAVAILLGILAAIGWARSGRQGPSSAPSSSPPAWAGATPPAATTGGPAPAPPAQNPGTPIPPWQETPDGHPPAVPPAA